MQQQLAKLQMNLEKVHENHSIIAQMREAAEDAQRKVREAYKGTYGEVSAQRQKVAKHQAELDQLAATLRQVEAYNEQMRSEIAVTRRARVTSRPRGQSGSGSAQIRARSQPQGWIQQI